MLDALPEAGVTFLWNKQEAIQFCAAIETVCPEYGYHVALTGGCLYKEGARKDADILFYSIRQEDADRPGLISRLSALGVSVVSVHGWMLKATYQGKGVDIFFPETPKTTTDDYQPTKETT